MTPTQSFAALAFGVLLATLGLFLALGPWALVGAGLVVAVVALLVPHREPEPEDPPANL